MSKKDVINYVMDTPGNTNPAVLKTLLDGLEAQDNRFIVTITPTALDYSGTMDKTSNEITQAYEAGKKIIFKVIGFPGFDNVYIPAAWCTYATGRTLCAACATLVNIISDTQIILISSDADDSNDYYTHVYTLTPAT